MFWWFGFAVGSAATFLIILIVLAFVRTTKDTEWIDAERQFRAELVARWEQSHKDNETRNGLLEEIRNNLGRL